MYDKVKLEDKHMNQKGDDIMPVKVRLGQVVVTRGINNDMAENLIFAHEVWTSLKRHENADFSDMEHKEDIEANLRAIETGEDRIFSSYNTSKGKIWIITEWDGSVTTILYPGEY